MHQFERCRARITKDIATIEHSVGAQIAARDFNGLQNSLGQLDGLVLGLYVMSTACDGYAQVLADDLAATARASKKRVLSEMRGVRRSG